MFANTLWLHTFRRKNLSTVYFDNFSRNTAGMGCCCFLRTCFGKKTVCCTYFQCIFLALVVPRKHFVVLSHKSVSSKTVYISNIFGLYLYIALYICIYLYYFRYIWVVFVFLGRWGPWGETFWSSVIRDGMVFPHKPNPPEREY